MRGCMKTQSAWVMENSKLFFAILRIRFHTTFHRNRLVEKRSKPVFKSSTDGWNLGGDKLIFQENLSTSQSSCKFKYDGEIEEI